MHHDEVCQLFDLAIQKEDLRFVELDLEDGTLVLLLHEQLAVILDIEGIATPALEHHWMISAEDTHVQNVDFLEAKVQPKDIGLSLVLHKQIQECKAVNWLILV